MRKTYPALSLTQPWAGMVALGLKTIETRWWATKYRGPLVICSTKQLDMAAVQYLVLNGFLSPEHRFSPALQQLGQALCVVDVVDCRPCAAADSLAARVLPPDMEGKFGWVLENLRVLEPFPIKGHQKIWSLDVSEQPQFDRLQAVVGEEPRGHQP